MLLLLKYLQSMEYEIEYLDKGGSVTKNLEELHKVRVRSTKNKTNYAVHSHIYLKDPEEGKVYGKIAIAELPNDTVLEKLTSQGSSESLILTIDRAAIPNKTSIDKIDTNDELIHHRGITEHSFTSTGAKLNYHWPIFQKLQDTGYGSIIRATLTLHQRCSSKCPYCSTINRKSDDEISLDEAKEFIKKLYFDQADFNKERFRDYNDAYKEISGSDIRLRSVILSGGGQPNLWPHFEELLEWISNETDLKVGLITNGFPKNVNEDVYKKFEWIRVSITPASASSFYPDGKFDKQYIPSTILKRDKAIKVGFSYVYGPWTEKNELKNIDNAAKTLGFDYVRVLTDCTLTRSSQLEAHRLLSRALRDVALIDSKGIQKSRTFHQLKYHASSDEAKQIWPSGQCMLQTYNVFWDTTGHKENGTSYCYPCDSVTVLTNEEVIGEVDQDSARAFDPNIWGTVTNDKVENLFRHKVEPFFDPRTHCKGCLFAVNNKKAGKLASMNKNEVSEIMKAISTSEKPHHIEFP